MKHKRNEALAWLITFIFLIAIFAIVILFDKWLFESVTNSNLPDWLKWFLLR